MTSTVLVALLALTTQLSQSGLYEKVRSEEKLVFAGELKEDGTGKRDGIVLVFRKFGDSINLQVVLEKNAESKPEFYLDAESLRVALERAEAENRRTNGRQIGLEKKSPLTFGIGTEAGDARAVYTLQSIEDKDGVISISVSRRSRVGSKSLNGVASLKLVKPPEKVK